MVVEIGVGVSEVVGVEVTLTVVVVVVVEVTMVVASIEAQQMALSLFQSLWLTTRLRGRGRWGDKGVHKAQVAVRELGTLRRAC